MEPVTCPRPKCKEPGKRSPWGLGRVAGGALHNAVVEGQAPPSTCRPATISHKVRSVSVMLRSELSLWREGVGKWCEDTTLQSPVFPVTSDSLPLPSACHRGLSTSLSRGDCPLPCHRGLSTSLSQRTVHHVVTGDCPPPCHGCLSVSLSWVTVHFLVTGDCPPPCHS